MDKFEQFRAGFPAVKDQTFLSICDKIILHDRVRGAIDEFLDHQAHASANRVQHEVKVEGAREKFARLMNVESSTIAAVRNVSDGVNIVALALPLVEGDNVVIATDAEHPNNIYPWLKKKKSGVELRIIDTNADGSLNIDAMIGAIDKRTRVLTCATVTFAPGHRTDVHRLGDACRKNDVFFLVDGVQSAGIMHHDLIAEQIDGFATSTSKGLLGLYGYGFLYVSPNWIDRMEPAYISRNSVTLGADDHSTMGQHDYTLQPDSRRFEVGSYNLAGAYAVDTSLDMLLDLGAPAIEKRVLSLATAFNEGLKSVGVTPAVPASGHEQSHVLTVGQLNAGGHGFSTDPTIEPISAHLTEGRVAHTIRRGQLRFAIHAYNNESDIERAIACVQEALKAK